MASAEIVWNGTMEAEAIRRQQIRVQPTPKRAPIPGAGRTPTQRMYSLRRTCLRVLESTGEWMSVAEVASQIGQERRAVSYVLSVMAQDGRVRRERKTVNGSRRAPQRYRIAGGTA